MIRTGLIGYGLGGMAFHAPLIEAVPELTLAAIATSRAEAVRDVLVKDGLTKDDIVANAGAPEDDPVAASEWPTERRVDIRVATRHAK